MEQTFLESLSLPPETLQQITDEAGAIRANQKRSIRLRIENGQHLRNLKTLIGHGGWLTWLVEQADVGYNSARTVERDMALAEYLYIRLDEIDEMESLTSVTALFELCRANAHEDALDTALHLMGQGQEINAKQATALTFIYEVNAGLGDHVRQGDLTIPDAYAVAQRLEELNPPAEVVALVVGEQVRSPGMVDALTVMYAEQHQQFEEVRATGSIFNPVAGVEVPLSEASRGDGFSAVDTNDTEREARRQQYIRSWQDRQPGRLGVVTGRRHDLLAQLAEIVPDDNHQYRVYVYPVLEKEKAPDAAS